MALLLIGWILNTIALYVTMAFVPGLHIAAGTQGYVDALIGALILAVINKIIKPIIMILTLPINLLTLGLFSFIILGFTFWLMTYFAPGLHADGFLPALIGALIFTLLNSILHLIFEPEPKP